VRRPQEALEYGLPEEPATVHHDLLVRWKSALTGERAAIEVGWLRPAKALPSTGSGV